MTTFVKMFYTGMTNTHMKGIDNFEREINSWASANRVRIISDSIAESGNSGYTDGWAAAVVYEQ